MMQRTHILRKASRSSPSQSVSSILKILQRAVLILLVELELDEEGTRISLTVVDTPGFGDQIDNEARYVMSVNYLDKADTHLALARL